jgi:Tfp pilus assembly protein PilX
MTKVKRSNQRGVALIFALIFILVLSVLAVSVLFVSQLETFSSLNYREMTQARYGAEAGLNSATNYIVNTYCAPGNTTCSNGNAPTSGDTLSLYNTNVSPVTLVSNGSAVTLSTTSSAANYPVAAVETAFRSAALGSLAAGSTTVNYTATATLVAMNQVTTAAGSATVQTWSVTANGSISGIRTATEQVTGVVEQQVTFAAVSAPSYAVFATATGCDALELEGNGLVQSFNSKAPLVSGNIAYNSWGGNIGTNGNTTLTGSSTVDGTLSTPRTGVNGGKGATCPAGVDAETYTGTAGITGCGTAAPTSPATTCPASGSAPVLLSQNVSYALPSMPSAPSSFNTGAGITIGASTTCASLGFASGCSGSKGALTLSPSAEGATGFPAILVNGGASLTLSPGTYNINSISASNGGSITVSASTASTTINTNAINLSGGNSMTITNSNPVTLNVYDGLGSATVAKGGSGVSLTNGTAMDLSGTSVVTMNIQAAISNPFLATGAFSNVNSSGIPTPADFQLNYAGTSTISLQNGTACAGVLYAPSAPVSLTGNGAWYGSIVGSTVVDTNSASIYYDQALGATNGGSVIATVQPFMMDSFSWARF